MKRLAMAAAFAVALSLGGLSPTAAQADDTTPSDVQAAPGTDEDSTADEPGADDPAADGPGSEGQGSGQSTSDPTEANEPTDPDDPATDEDDADPDEDAGPINADFSLDQKTMTAEEAGQGIPFTITGLKAGDTVTAIPDDEGPTTVEDDGTFNGTLDGNTELKAGDTLKVTVTVARADQETKTFNAEVAITAAADAELSADPEVQSLDRFHNDGVGLTMSGCAVGDEVAFEVTRSGEDTAVLTDSQFADDDGAAFTTLVPDTEGEEWIGDFTATATCGDTTAEATLTVTANNDDSDADLTVTPKTQKLSDFLEHGVDITFVNCPADSDVVFRISTLHDPDTEIWSEKQKAGEDAAGYSRFIPDGDGGPGWATEFLVMATCGDKSAETTFTVTDDGSAIDPKLSITPERIPGTDFIDRDKGVHLTITKCTPDTDVHFEVWNADKTEKLYEQTAESNKDGTAGIQVYGLGDDPASYVGTYAVTADCADITRDGKFVVTDSGSDPAGGGDTGEAGDTGSSSMPRTGAELTGLAAGTLLILAGGAAIVLARRNKLG